jgi:hypothetical protein
MGGKETSWKARDGHQGASGRMENGGIWDVYLR